MEGSQAVREPCNCSHAFHRECLDVWIDEGQLTRPLCRSELVPNSTPKTKDHKEMGDFEEDDPWRSERMIYRNIEKKLRLGKTCKLPCTFYGYFSDIAQTLLMAQMAQYYVN
ncbi:hypothetical protein ACE6H2_009253 [Prunus campanulata]